jgi:hypothetical protein
MLIRYGRLILIATLKRRHSQRVEISLAAMTLSPALLRRKTTSAALAENFRAIAA